MLKTVYTFFTGLLLATFVGVGIAAFYVAPKPPEYPTVLSRPATKETPELTAEQQKTQEEFDAANKVHQEKFKTYARNVSLGALGFAVLFAVLGLLLAERILVLADGVLLGGFFTLLYSIGWGFATEDNRFRFLMVTIGLVVALTLGYLKFVRPEQAHRRR